MSQAQWNRVQFRAQVLDMLEAGTITQKEAANRLQISDRQVRRLVVAYRGNNMGGLVSKKLGAQSNGRIPASIIADAVELIGIKYRDFGPTFASEKLADSHQIHLSAETTRQAMIRAGYWQAKRGSTARPHPMRERRSRVGELIRIDGSLHDWFEGRSAACTLIVFIDDATSRITTMRFAPTETTLGYMHALHDHISTHGVPAALYSDKHSIFRVNAKQIDAGAETQFSRAGRELSISCIHAHSPQAKGRVERANQTLQDRMIKEMRLAGINDIEGANAWLPSYIIRHNAKFAILPADPVDAHIPYQQSPESLQQILSVQITRTVSKNLSCQVENQLLQITTTGSGLGLRGAKITVHTHFNGRLELRWKQKSLKFTMIKKRTKQEPTVDSKDVNRRVDEAIARLSAVLQYPKQSCKKQPNIEPCIATLKPKPDAHKQPLYCN